MKKLFESTGYKYESQLLQIAFWFLALFAAMASIDGDGRGTSIVLERGDITVLQKKSVTF